MVHIFTFCDRTLIGRKNISAKFLCENLYKLNLKISEVSIFPYNYDYGSINFKNNDVYFLLMQKSSPVLNSYLASLSGKELKENETLKKVLHEYYKACNIPIDKAVELEYVIPENAQAITNPNGRTQGFMVKLQGTQIFVLPSEIKELERIYYDVILSYLEKNYSFLYKSETYKTFGISEEYLMNLLHDLVKNKDKITVSFFSKGLNCDIIIKAKQDNSKFEDYRRKIFSILEKYIYSVNGKSLEDELIELIHSFKTRISFVGDMSICGILKKLSSDACEDNICESVILNNKQSVKSYLINENIAQNDSFVSAEVAYELAVKMLDKVNCDLVFASLCENGQTLIAIGNKLKIDIYKNQFVGTKQEIFQNVADAGVFYLINKLKSRDFKLI